MAAGLITSSVSHHFMANRWGNSGNNDRLFLAGAGGGVGSKITADGECSLKLKDACSLEEKLRPMEIAY